MTPSLPADSIAEDAGIPIGDPRKPYTIEYGNWYQSIPYALRVVSTNPSADIDEIAVFFFPVNPESINISTPFAAVITPTLGGIVQEHSGPVFYNITINGTTGILPANNYNDGTFLTPEDNLRPTAAGDSFISPEALGGFGQNTINAINSIVSTITGISSKVVDGTRNQKSGYTAFHVLYKFFWWYHFAKSQGSQQQLKFVNYKDNNQYDIVVQNFSLTRDKGSPHLYRYSIQLKAWNLEESDTFPALSADDQAAQLAALGLDEGPSVKADLFRVINDTKSVLNGAAGLLNAGASDFAI